MLLNQLSISYKCHNSIGNSLKLELMIEEVVKTFIKETDSIYGAFYLLEDELPTRIFSLGKKIDYKVEELLKHSLGDKINVYNYDENLNILLYKVEKGISLFVYDKEMDLDFIIQIFESLRMKLNISISSCLNVQSLEEKNKELNELTLNLKNEVSKAVELNKQKEKQMFEQMKMAQMGELIGNIAHQWRQPLSIISTVASGMKLKKEMNMLSDEDFSQYADRIVDNSQLLSKTIDEFRDYIKESHKEKNIIVQERVRMSLKIIEPSYDLNKIKIIEGFLSKEPIYFKLISGELLQVLISILSNSKEAFIEGDIEDRWVKYTVDKDDTNILITVEDSAGGIPDDIIDKIFNPYFTTKHQRQGTGIGLYNAYNIITSHLDGNLYVKNTEFGAKFFIELPLNREAKI